MFKNITFFTQHKGGIQSLKVFTEDDDGYISYIWSVTKDVWEADKDWWPGQVHFSTRRVLVIYQEFMLLIMKLLRYLFKLSMEHIVMDMLQQTLLGLIMALVLQLTTVQQCLPMLLLQLSLQVLLQCLQPFLTAHLKMVNVNGLLTIPQA